MSLEVGAILEGEVTGITNFGAFVQLPEGKIGLVHISEVRPERINKISDVLKEGDKVKVVCMGIDNRGKIKLSMKRVDQTTGEPVQLEEKPMKKKHHKEAEETSAE